MTRDIIDQLSGIAPGSHLDTVRHNRSVARDNAQNSYVALFEPSDPAGVSLFERFALAAFVTGLHGDTKIADHYRATLARTARPDALAALGSEVLRAAGEGPYGRYPAGPLSVEDIPGPVHQIAQSNRQVLGQRLAAGLEHAHLLVFRPREASADALATLLAAGWTTADIVTLSQLVAFLSFQIRVIIGLRALAAATIRADAGLIQPVSPVSLV
ncbi:MAG: hypothetical protein JWR75_1354 [Devosia sp.]|nr:hypothetical protein [Devosia sp.]